MDDPTDKTRSGKTGTRQWQNPNLEFEKAKVMEGHSTREQMRQIAITDCLWRFADKVEVR
ncbi:MAG: hypothetical protein ABI839_06640 [Verrucomicrobiota bacterium]